MTTLEKIGLGVIVVPLVIIIIGLLLILPAWWAWNIFMVSIFGLPTINFWQAVALVVLTGLVRAININNNKK
jgi:hypothetical protein